MSRHNVAEALGITVLISAYIGVGQAGTAPQSNGGACDDPATYFASALGTSGQALRQHLHDAISGHTVVPYTSTALDTWDALDVLDATPGEEGETVWLIYSQRSEGVDNSGTSDGWNREHVWPKSYGVGYTGPDTSDLLSLRAADWNVNSARSNLYFGECSPDDGTGCSSPAHVEAAESTAKNSELFMPPADVRGDLARSLFYMAVRYDGSEANTEDLELSDSPCEYLSHMGLLSDLLAWHAEDPPDDAERARNDLVCSEFQGNRNPFIDYPEWVDEIDWAGASATNEACEAPEDPTTPGDGEGTLLVAGDIAIALYVADNPDAFALVALVELEAGTQIHITDSGWTGEALRSTEGVVTFTTPSEGVDAGTVLVWEGEQEAPWSKSGSLALSSTGDQLLAFTGSTSDPSFLFGVTTHADGWSPSDGSVDSASESALPAGLVDGETAVAIPGMQNGVYVGVTEGTREVLLQSISTAARWVTSDSRDAGGATHPMLFRVTADGGGDGGNSDGERGDGEDDDDGEFDPDRRFDGEDGGDGVPIGASRSTGSVAVVGLAAAIVTICFQRNGWSRGL